MPSLVTLLKNLVWFGCIALAFALAWKHFVHVPRFILVLLAAYLLSFPQLVQYGSLLDVEEGYLIPLFALLFVALLLFDRLRLGSNWRALLLLAMLNASLFLIKSSMLYFSLVFGVAFALRSRSLRVLGLFAGLTLSAALGWGLLNLQHSGTFTLASSYDGLNLYKGNNPLAVTLYPPHNLDMVPVDGLRATTPPPVNEWTLNRHATGEALRFIRAHPLDALRLLLGRFYILFLEVRRTPLWERETQIAGPIQWAGILYMLVFRVAFFVSLGIGAAGWLRRSRMHSRAESRLFITFLALVLAYAGPYLAGFAYERHVLPLIIPTLAYGVYLLDHARTGQELRFRAHAVALRRRSLFLQPGSHLVIIALRELGPWPSGKASPLHGEDRRFESGRVHSRRSARHSALSTARILTAGRKPCIMRL